MKLFQLVIQLVSDNVESKEVLELLEKAIDLKLATGEAKIAAIGTDVFYKQINGEEKKSAIHVQILQSNGETIGYYATYRNENGSFVCEKPFKE